MDEEAKGDAWLEIEFGGGRTISGQTVDELLRHLTSILQSAERDLTHCTPTVDWGWSDSHVRIVASANGVDRTTLAAISNRARATIRDVAETVPAGVSPDPSRKHLAAMARALREAGSVTVDTQDSDPVTVEISGSGNLQYTRTTSVAFSSVEGIVEVLSNRGGYNFSIKERDTGKLLVCEVGLDLVEPLMECWRKRQMVVLEGLIRYRADGSPMSIREVARITPRPDSRRDLEDFIGALPGFSGDQSPEEYVRHLRSGDDDE